jgi:3-oxoacyl-[acyl-carrier protein] reductase
MDLLKDKTVLVTGGTAGIGLVIAKSFAASGADVIINDIQEPDFNLADNNIKAFYKFNIADATEVTTSMKQILTDHGKIDILINNAGLTRDNLFLRMTEEQWDTVMDVNLKGAFNVTKALSKQFMKNRAGSIINITSVVGQTGNPGQANYVASKAGLIGLTKTLAQELAARGIRVNAIAPGFIKTKMTEVLTDEVKEEFYKRVPLKSFGEPEDIANAAIFLASDNARYITGQVINVNGGLYM